MSCFQDMNFPKEIEYFIKQYDLAFFQDMTVPKEIEYFVQKYDFRFQDADLVK